MVFFQLCLAEGAEIGVDHISVRLGFDRMQEFPVQSGDSLPLIVEVIGAVNMDTHEIRLVRVGVRQAALGVGEVNILPNFLHADIFVEHIAVNQRFSQLIVAEAAACAGYGILAIAVAVNDTLAPLGSNAVGVVTHFHQNEFAVSTIGFVHAQNGVGGGAGTGKGIEDDRIRIGCNL